MGYCKNLAAPSKLKRGRHRIYNIQGPVHAAYQWDRYMPVQGVGPVRIKIDPSPLSEITIVFSKAFDMLERLDPNPEYWEGKRGACVGVFQMIIAG